MANSFNDLVVETTDKLVRVKQVADGDAPPSVGGSRSERDDDAEWVVLVGDEVAHVSKSKKAAKKLREQLRDQVATAMGHVVDTIVRSIEAEDVDDSDDEDEEDSDDDLDEDSDDGYYDDLDD